MTQSLRLHYAPDNASLIIRLALEELGLPYETVLIDRSQQGQHAPEYLRLNPNGQIPALETPDGPLFETAAILLWLADRYRSGPALLSPDLSSPQRAPFLKWLFWMSNTLQSELRISFYPEKYIPPQAGQEAHGPDALRQQIRARIQTHLTMLERELSQTTGIIGGDNPTVLDLYLPCLLRWCALYAQDQTGAGQWLTLSDHPTLHRICAKAEARASTHRAQTAEGLGPTPFTAPQFATPPEGSAT